MSSWDNKDRRSRSPCRPPPHDPQLGNGVRANLSGMFPHGTSRSGRNKGTQAPGQTQQQARTCTRAPDTVK